VATAERHSNTFKKLNRNFMSMDIGIKLNKEVSSDQLRDKFYSWEKETNISDDIYCLSPSYCGMVLSKHYENSEPIISELSKALNFDCTFIQEPKVNHNEEDEETRFQFGWVNSISFLDNLKNLKKAIDTNSEFQNKLNLKDEWKWYFDKKNIDTFSQEIDNLIEVLEVGNSQGVTEICYSVG
jgi:cobalamin biosynthesis protein CbiG